MLPQSRRVPAGEAQVRLTSFRVRNFRSVNDSGNIEVRQRTALVGRNESGKSNLLIALRSLNPPGDMQALSDIKDFPRERKLSEFSDQLPVLHTRADCAVRASPCEDIFNSERNCHRLTRWLAEVYELTHRVLRLAAAERRAVDLVAGARPNRGGRLWRDVHASGRSRRQHVVKRRLSCIT